MERVAEITGKAPPALAARVEAWPSLHGYVETFNLLSGSRPFGPSGPSPIPLSEIESYCRLYGWTRPEEVSELVEIVRAMDDAYLATMAARHGGSDDRHEVPKGGERGRHRRLGSAERGAQFIEGLPFRN